MTATENAVAVRAVREIFAAIDSGDVDALCRQVTDDVRFQFGNAEVITGRSAALSLLAGQVSLQLEQTFQEQPLAALTDVSDRCRADGPPGTRASCNSTHRQGRAVEGR